MELMRVVGGRLKGPQPRVAIDAARSDRQPDRLRESLFNILDACL